MEALENKIAMLDNELAATTAKISLIDRLLIAVHFSGIIILSIVYIII